MDVLPHPESENLRLRRVSAASSPDFDALVRIYSEAHPEAERKNVNTLRQMLERPEYFFFVLAGEQVVGFSIAIAFAESDAGLLEYMAVDAGLRGRGIGQKLFGETMAYPGVDGRFVLIEVDSDRGPSADRGDRTRRKAFYWRLNCREVEGLAYLMPRVAESKPPAMELMVYRRELPAAIEADRLKGWLECCYSQVYQQPRDDRRIEKMISPLPSHVRLL